MCVQLRLTSDEEVPLCSRCLWLGKADGETRQLQPLWEEPVSGATGTDALLEFVCRGVEVAESSSCVASHQSWVDDAGRAPLASHRLCDSEQVTSQESPFLHPIRKQETTKAHSICLQEGSFCIVLTTC